MRKSYKDAVEITLEQVVSRASSLEEVRRYIARWANHPPFIMSVPVAAMNGELTEAIEWAINKIKNCPEVYDGLDNDLKQGLNTPAEPPTSSPLSSTL